MKYLFFAAAALLLFTIFFHNVIELDQDLGRHLLMGKIILETHSFPKTNLLSFSYPNFPFINSHWLSEVIFSLVGLKNLLVFKTLINLSAFLLTLFTAYKYSKNLAATALAFLVFVPVLLERTEIRPEIFSYLFIALFMYILLLRPKLIWLLPIIEILWVNTHIYFFLGPILVFVFRRFSLPVLLVMLASLVNPNGLSGAIYPLTVFSNYGYSIQENQNIFFLRSLTNNPNIFYFELAALAFIISCFFNKFNWLSLLLVLPAWHIRSFPLLFLILLPVFAFNLQGIKKHSKIILVAVILLTLFRSFRLMTNEYYQTINSSKRFGWEISESGKGAADFVLQNNLQGPLFNNFDIGSYLDYRFYPNLKVYVDGRPEAYPADFFQSVYIPQNNAFSGNFNLIVFSHTDQTPWGIKFLQNIGGNPKYKLAYLDKYAVVFVSKDQPITSQIIEPQDPLEWVSFGRAAELLGLANLAQKASLKTYVLKPTPPLIFF